MKRKTNVGLGAVLALIGVFGACGCSASLSSDESSDAVVSAPGDAQAELLVANFPSTKANTATVWDFWNIYRLPTSTPTIMARGYRAATSVERAQGRAASVEVIDVVLDNRGNWAHRAVDPSTPIASNQDTWDAVVADIVALRNAYGQKQPNQAAATTTATLHPTGIASTACDVLSVPVIVASVPVIVAGCAIASDRSGIGICSAMYLGAEAAEAEQLCDFN